MLIFSWADQDFGFWPSLKVMQSSSDKPGLSFKDWRQLPSRRPFWFAEFQTLTPLNTKDSLAASQPPMCWYSCEGANFGSHRSWKLHLSFSQNSFPSGSSSHLSKQMQKEGKHTLMGALKKDNIPTLWVLKYGYSVWNWSLLLYEQLRMLEQ